MFNQLNPQAQEFHPQTYLSLPLPLPFHLPLPLPLTLSPHNYYSLYQKPLLPAPPVPPFYPAPPPRYLEKFGARLLFPPFSRYNANHQPQPQSQPQPPPVSRCHDDRQPHGHLPVSNSGAGNGVKKLRTTTARGRVKSSQPKRRNKVREQKKYYAATTSSTATVKIRSPPCPTKEEDGTTIPLSGKTTVMIKNIPNKYRRHMLMEFLDALCLEQNHTLFDHLGGPRFEYDFLYLPMDFRRNNNLGYAFVNFTSGMAATLVHEILRDFKWGVFKDVNGGIVHPRKVCEITWAKTQGKEEMANRFTKSYFPCRDVEYLPVVFFPPRDGANPASSLSVVGRCLPPQ